jgi:hypothetical protein
MPPTCTILSKSISPITLMAALGLGLLAWRNP